MVDGKKSTHTQKNPQSPRSGIPSRVGLGKYEPSESAA